MMWCGAAREQETLITELQTLAHIYIQKIHCSNAINAERESGFHEFVVAHKQVFCSATKNADNERFAGQLFELTC